ncbi:hypothetical protein A0R60_2307 [Enterobacter asburiae]|nr:hypothetical protein A0R60_2307 [Enterobacter asburiae]
MAAIGAIRSAIRPQCERTRRDRRRLPKERLRGGCRPGAPCTPSASKYRQHGLCQQRRTLHCSSRGGCQAGSGRTRFPTPASLPSPRSAPRWYATRRRRQTVHALSWHDRYPSARLFRPTTSKVASSPHRLPAHHWQAQCSCDTIRIFDRHSGQALAQCPQPTRRIRVSRPWVHAGHDRMADARFGHVAILAIQAAHTVQLRAGRAPDTRCGALLRILGAFFGIDDRVTRLVADARRDDGFGRHEASDVGQNPAGMNGKAPNPMTCPPTVKLNREQHVGRLGLPIGNPRVIFPVVKVRVAQIDRRKVVPLRGDGDHARALRPNQGRPQAAEQLEVAQMVRAELGLVATGIARQRVGHDAGAVDQDVDDGMLRQHSVRKGVDRGGIKQVHRLDRHPGNVTQRLRRLLDVPRRNDDRGASGRKRFRSRQADARVTARHDCGLSCQADAAQHIVCGRGSTKAGA